ncbi:restriction endonuclease subunit S [Streptosporangium sp. OZ121]|uniref:restriction endonuclease subunit S n=1 Tax=Streptosporangium sp. OZ121 TaxID=3444183 RepID=UPI003F78FDB8
MSVTTYPEVALGTFLRQEADTVAIDPDATYTTAGIYSYGRGLFKRPPITGSETNYPKYNRIRKGQFIYSKLFGWEGALATVPEEFDGLYVSHEFPTFHIDNTIADPGYVAHLATWPGLHDKLRDQGTGMGSRRQRVNVDRLISATVPLPNLDEQRRIADRLDAATAKLGELAKLRSRAEALRVAIRESVFHEEQGNAPTRLGNVLSLERILVTLEPDTQYSQIGIRSFGKGIFHRPPVPGSELSKLKYFEIHPDRLVVSNIMAWEGAIAISGINESGFIGSHRFLTYRPSDAVDIRYLNYFFQTRAGRDLIRSTSTGTVLRNQTLSMKDFESLSVALPSKRRQEEIARMLDRLEDTQNRSDQQADLGVTLTKSLLNAAFSGRL